MDDWIKGAKIMKNRFQGVKNIWKGKRGIAGILIVSIGLSLTGCGEEKKEEKPMPGKIVEIDDGTTNASDSGNGQSDAPFIIGVDKLSGNFNPFSAKTDADRMVVGLTQTTLIPLDRSGKAVYHGVDGEFRTYQGEHYTYYGAADLDISYNQKKNETTYHIALRHDLVFSDREVLSADDVIFTLYALCDKSYEGNFSLQDMPIKGLLNYRANSTKAEKYSKKQVKQYMKTHPVKLEKWITQQIIKKELEQGYLECEKNYKEAGYETNYAYFAAKYHLKHVNHIIEQRVLIRKAMQQYQKKGYQTLAQDAYSRKDYFNERVQRQARIYMAEGKGKKISSITGIVRLGDFELEIKTSGYHRKMTNALNIPICPLHYYGDKEKYNYEKHKFGFRRGDISAVRANKAMPMGAGAYRYVKLEDGVAYFTSNELYFLGCPKTAYVHVKEMSDILIETKQQVLRKQNGNPSAELMELTQGTVDVIQGTFWGEKFHWILDANSNGESSGKSVESRFISGGNYFYLGIHGKNVSVEGKPLSEASKALRKAIASVFSVARQELLEENGESVVLPDYPTLKESWTVPLEEEEQYQIAYNQGIDGKSIYQEEEQEEKIKRVCEASLLYLETAGYTVEEGRVTQAPEGAALSYKLLLPAGEKNLCYPAVKRGIEILGSIGISIQTKEVAGEKALEKILQTGKQELWLSCQMGDGVEITERYRKNQGKMLFGCSDTDFRGTIKKLQGYLPLQDRQELYQSCYQMLLNRAVEVPMAEFCHACLFRANGIVTDTIPTDITLYYDPMREIQKIQMK